MARAAAQVEAVRRVAGVEESRVMVREQLRALDDEYAREWGAALKLDVPEVELKKVGEVPGAAPKRRAPKAPKPAKVAPAASVEPAGDE